MPFTVAARVAYAAELNTLGDHIQKKRLDLGLLQQDVARQLAVDEDSVRHWETGRSHPKPYLIPRVIDFLGYAPWTAPRSLGVWLVMARRANGLSRKRLGRRYHIDESTLWRLENGKSQPTPQLGQRLRALLLSIVSGTSNCTRPRGRTQ